ncbi:50S ribosomal protein L22 [uncultured Ilumatobacter sp.]|uniref:50S ribosomal protein L22 n=1 Tax=uncultured Ilumatobacter sp. TaxID=879968 RepID=UPI00374F1756
MTGPKLNEKSYVAGERSGTKATAKYVRTSASKIRAVLDLVRGLDVKSADQVLQLTERHTAIPVRKLLASAVANAVNNDNQDADELYVIACFADEGPTLKRFKPRARGRASRILKRTCHVTIIVARMSDERIAMIQARAERQGAGSGRPAATSRRDRVARSRAKDDSGEESAGQTVDDVVEETSSDAVSAAIWEGSVDATDDGEAPEGYEIKGNAQSMLFHTPDSRYYKATKAEVWFDTEESAVAAGFSKPGTTAADTEEAAEAEADNASNTAADEAEEN